MSSEFNFYGLNVSELVFFGILAYLAVLLTVIVIVRTIQFRAFCPFSGQCVHCSHVNSCSSCPKCSLLQSSRSVFCCKRNHTVYENWSRDIPKFKFSCFKPDCSYLRCCCCEFYVVEGEKRKEEQAATISSLESPVEIDV